MVYCAVIDNKIDIYMYVYVRCNVFAELKKTVDVLTQIMFLFKKSDSITALF